MDSRIRYHLLDALRGLSDISMVLYHAMWDIVYIVGISAPWYKGLPGRIWQQSICWSFIFLSGFCAVFSKNSLRAGLIVSGSGLIVTSVTILVMPENRVIFGVLTLLGACMLLAALVKITPLVRFPAPCAAVCALLFFLTKEISRGYLGFATLKILDLPDALYANILSTFFGFPSPQFYSSDYFPIFPWAFLFFAGFFLSTFIKEKNAYPSFLQTKIPPLSFIGRHSLIIYLLHQPVLYFLFTLTFGNLSR